MHAQELRGTDGGGPDVHAVAVASRHPGGVYAQQLLDALDHALRARVEIRTKIESGAACVLAAARVANPHLPVDGRHG